MISVPRNKRSSNRLVVYLGIKLKCSEGLPSTQGQLCIYNNSTTVVVLDVGFVEQNNANQVLISGRRFCVQREGDWLSSSTKKVKHHGLLLLASSLSFT